jgi:hypothetical protein
VTAPSKQTYLVECFVPGSDRNAVEAAGLRVQEAAADLRAEGRDVDYLRAILVPGDEVVFHVFAAADVATVREASRRAEVEYERVVASVAVDVPGGRGESERKAEQ